ncbi:maackiain detoxification [Armillaria fumosa]|nr:maackiain detoxification [Armillaria fumosa]
MVREPLSGIDILITASFKSFRNAFLSLIPLRVRGGLAGLTAAIECYHKGHNVRVVERRPGLELFGDLIGIQPSALRVMRKWPGFVESSLRTILDQTSTCTKEGAVALSRLDAHRALHEYATASPRFRGVQGYSEIAEKGFIILREGSALEADLVIAADGVGGKGWSLVSGKKEEPVSSGYAIYHTTFPLEHAALKNPGLAKVYDEKSHVTVHIGYNRHIVTGKNNNVCWMMTYLVYWSKTKSSDRALHWSSIVPALVNSVPNKEAIDWKLMWRNPQTKWVSPMGRVAQIGDAAHRLLPTSASGATMAMMEDGIALAACLHISGKNHIPLAARVYNKLRFERVSCAQRMGFKTREQWHHTEWDAIMKNPKPLSKIVGNWLAKHNQEQYSYGNYTACTNNITEGAPFTNTNMAPSYTYEPWTVQDLLQAAKEGRDVLDAGDWS